MAQASGRVGQYVKSSGVGGEYYNSYVPNPLPPNPPLEMNELFPLLDQASVALGRLDGMSMILPDPSLFIYMYVRKEAVLSSQIEGTQSSLSDLLLFETTDAPGVPIDDVTEVSCYVEAMSYGLERLKELPLSLRLIREIHGKLMNNSRGGHKMPGEFRTSQNWIGGSRPGNAAFVPPPPERLMEVLGEFEKFLHDEKAALPVLVKAAMAHVQFETIHPFLDGNGRLGRLLITFILCEKGILKQPLLYLSLYFKTNREKYYGLLQSVRETGNLEDWVRFFLVGVAETANQATDTAKNILALFAKDKERIVNSGRHAASVFTVYDFMKRYPVTNTTRIKDDCDLALPTVLRALNALESLGITKEATGKGRHKIFVYDRYLSILNQGAEPFAN
ncbi:Fic family protein [Rhodomicrobium lacus]|uniref:Fic family protein n=1 Tax=Rhodomicrobium lacus TaxID=2498452 RepID=UPI000F8DB466|nr:Fic family protein [Rhodomicrobium lacus]